MFQVLEFCTFLHLCMNNDVIHILTNICISLLKLWVQWQDCCKWYRANWYLWQWFQVWINASWQRCYRLLPVEECPMRWNALADLPGGDWCSANNCAYCLLWTRGGERIYPLRQGKACCIKWMDEMHILWFQRNLKYTQTVLDVTFFIFILA